MNILYTDDLAGTALLHNIELGLKELAKVIDMRDEVVHLSIDRAIQTATTEPAPDGGLNMRVNELYYAEVTSLGPTQEPGKDAPEYLGEHEGLHRWISLENPTFAALVSSERIGSSNDFTYFFHGANAMAAYGGPVPIDQYGHILGVKSLGDVMSGSYPTFRDRPQEPSALDLAMAKDGGATLVHPPSTLALLYAADFGRAPDVAGLIYWQHQLDAGMPLAAVAQSFFAQPEAQTAFVNGHIVETVFERAFGRPVDAGGLAYWQHELDIGAISLGQFTLAVINGAQGTDAQHLIDVVGVLPYVS